MGLQRPDDQSWTYTASKQLMVYGNKCLDASGQGTANGTAAIIWDCNGRNQPAVERQRQRHDHRRAVGLCVDADAAGTANGTLLHLWACHGGTNQQWTRS